MTRSNLFVRYKGNNVPFTGVDINPQPYASLDPQYGYLYKAQIDPFIIRNVSSPWQPGIPKLNYDNHPFFRLDA